MKLTCNRERLKAAFTMAASVAPRNSPKPILANVLLSATKQAVTLSATDLEIGVLCRVEGVEVAYPGSAVLSAARFATIVKEMTDDVVRIDASEKGITITGNHSKFTLPAADPKEFPALSAFSADNYYTVPSASLRTLIARTIYATDLQSSRYALGGIKLEVSSQPGQAKDSGRQPIADSRQLLAIATDGRRLAKMEVDCGIIGKPDPLPDSCVIPFRAMQLIARSVAKENGDVQLGVEGNELFVVTAQQTISARLLEGRYPRWRDVVPNRQQTNRIELEVGPLSHAVRQAAVATSEESRGINFSFQLGLLTLTAEAAEVGSSRIELPIKHDAGEVGITLDPRFVIDFLDTLDDAALFTFDVADAEHAVLFTTPDGYSYVAMPLARG